MTSKHRSSQSTPTLSELCRRVPEALIPLVPSTAPDLPLTAVHISELLDPTPYLDGGELLLTTGLTLPRRPDACRRYVDRLVTAGLSGMALGLGPVHHHPPTALERACASAGLPLLVVPDAVPFLAVTRGFWEAVGEEHERLLYAALDADRRIVAAATSTDPVPAVVRALAEAVQGWAVLVDVRGEPRQAWPPERVSDASRLAPEIERLRTAGARSAATFPLDDLDVVVHPVLADSDVVGYLAIVSSPPRRRTARRAVLVALALLGSEAVRRRHTESVDAVRRAAVAHLIDARQQRAGRLLAGALGVEFPSTKVRVVVALGGDGRGAGEVLAALVGALERHRPEYAGRWLGASDAESCWLLLPGGLPVPDASSLVAEMVAVSPESAAPARVVVGPIGDLADAPTVRVHLADRLAQASGRAAPGGPLDAVTDPPGWARALVEPLARHPRGDVVGAVAAYLRHRGHWEAASRDLGLHRNTLRARIARAESLLGGCLDDPDLASRVWLALRATGLA
jgi:purine catabolism regulator